MKRRKKCLILQVCLDADDLVELCELILDFESLHEVHDWINERSRKQTAA